MSREIRSFDYVNQPYDVVRAELTANAAGVLRAATTAANSRAESVGAELRVEIAGLQVAAPIEIELGAATEVEMGPTRTRTLRIPISWKAASRPGLFPTMTATLSAYPLTTRETQLDVQGEYSPPLGPVGTAIDAAAGHRIAEAAVHRFVSEVAHYLRERLTSGDRTTLPD
jgi:hypothetical protein